jgi:hypothetical protein
MTEWEESTQAGGDLVVVEESSDLPQDQLIAAAGSVHTPLRVSHLSRQVRES